MLTAESLKAYARDELAQREEEGCDVAELRQEGDALVADESVAAATWRDFLSRLAELEPRPDFGYCEPSALDEIRAARPEGVRRMELTRSGEQLHDRILGAWLGRCAGCMLGKPVEGQSKENIEALLKHAGEYPLGDYFPIIDNVPEGLRYRDPGDPCLGPNINHGVRDDDTDYTILGLHALQTYGADITSRQVAEVWLSRLPYHQVYTAERVAYRNLVNEIWPPESGRVDNPYREWIGAQIRCDGWAYCAPGRPEKAAEFAHRDAVVSHVKNGIYGEMYFAAVIAAALTGDDLIGCLAIGLTEIPKQSRLAEAVSDTMAWCAEDDDWLTTWDRIMAKYGHYHPVHTINNAALVIMGLLHARGDFGRCISIAVMGGLDTDCNGATAGSVMGALLGAQALPASWVDPLNDRLRSIIVGFADNRISELAQGTLAMAETVLAS
jgi:ADP-ribosylglycohydrolase